ncbi:MAG: hypothetical protein RL684_2156 [Pseudomonadota bacterium]
MSFLHPMIPLRTARASGLRALAAALLATSLLAACGGGGSASMGGGGGGGTSACTGSCGSALMTLQDAAGDFQSYTVDVVSIQLTKASGAAVETLPATARVDFAQLVNLSELFTAGQIPAGDYVAASVTLDYSNASILADDGNGGSVTLSPVDANGVAITGQVKLDVKLDNRNHLVITPARTARLALDFNLAASNTVDLVAGTVTVSPVIQADIVPPATEPVRVRGGFASADTVANSYVVDVHPFHLGSATLGQVTVHVSDTTSYEIDGTAYTGAAGLAQLAMEPVGTITAAFGTIDTATLAFTANRVLAGTSVESATSDRVQGVVTARNGDTLTVRGGTIELRDHSFRFLRGNVTVTVATGTKVVEAGDASAHAIGDISVGQRITAIGNATVDASTGTATLDASAGRVRLEVTSMWGLVTGSVASPLTLQLQAIEGRDPSHFDFSGTGATPATDASAAGYLVDTGTLSLAQLQAGAPARVFGFVLPFGTATASDFNARTVVSYSQVESLLSVNWMAPGTSGAFPGLTATSTSLSLDFTGVGMLHALRTGPLVVDLLSLSSPPQIVASALGLHTGYAIGHAHSHSIDNFEAYADFIAALAADMNGTVKALGIAASGHVDVASNTLAADHVAVVLGD